MKTAEQEKITQAQETCRIPKQLALFERASKVIPGGIYGHIAPLMSIPGVFPYYTDRAKGCHYWDVDGNEYIDYMCAFGPMVLGYHHPKVDEAAMKQAALADCTNHPGPVMVELAEYMVDMVSSADWVLLVKNGNDATSYATKVARAHTGRKKIVLCQGHYHGVAAWCTGPCHAGIVPEDHTNIIRIPWNDLDAFRKVVAENKGQIAGFMATPYHHPTFIDQVMPSEGYWKGIRETCDKEGIVLMVDDVRSGFRLNQRGSDAHFGFKADLICFGKAMGNCYPISACAGREEFRIAASKVFHTGSYWFAAVAMAASLACLKEMRDGGVVEKMNRMGKMLGDGLKDAARSHGLEVIITGPPAIPYMRFANETDLFRMQFFCAEVVKRGSFLHPHHNWFMCAAHEEADIRQTLGHADDAFKAVKEKFGS
ncbi:MAG TPA: aminotransferase class III-fold pyridoxal phosphate-dependent enzyme [Candidatus Brocadiia bacterium]|nr:aminotransferase class III-fold pyridoxal phosphate-dependent enzyme [Candidatus Brocadiia bacterium]